MTFWVIGVMIVSWYQGFKAVFKGKFDTYNEAMAFFSGVVLLYDQHRNSNQNSFPVPTLPQWAINVANKHEWRISDEVRESSGLCKKSQ